MDSTGSITQTLLLVVLFVAAMAFLPWLIRRLQQRNPLMHGGAGASRVVAAVAVGPQQRVVTVEVGPAHARTQLVLGVSAQQITCLHVLTLSPGLEERSQDRAQGVADFAQALAEVSVPRDTERRNGD